MLFFALAAGSILYVVIELARRLPALRDADARHLDDPARGRARLRDRLRARRRRRLSRDRTLAGVGDFFHAVRVFGDHLAAVRWEFLALALGLHFATARLPRGRVARDPRAAYPEERPAFRSVLGAYVAGVGVNSIAPARGGDLVKLYLIKHRIPEARYATLAPTLVAETLFDFVVAAR